MCTPCITQDVLKYYAVLIFRILWTHSEKLMMLRRSGIQKDPKNYRKIEATCTIGRIYSKVLRNVTEKETDIKQAGQQSGFWAGWSKINNIFILKLVTEKQVQ
jgi:hypothetical protein